MTCKHVLLHWLVCLLAGVAYELNGKRLPLGYMPTRLSELAAVKVVYEGECANPCKFLHAFMLSELPGWKEDISRCRRFRDLPTPAQV